MGELTPTEAANRLRRFQFATVATEFVDVAAPGIVAALRQEAPVGKGVKKPGEKRLRDSFAYERHSSTENVQLVVTNSAPQARFVLHGTRAHEVHPVGVSVDQPVGSGGHPLVFFWDKVNAVVASFGFHGSPYGFVRIPAHAPNRFNRRAWLLVREPVAKELGRLAARRLFGG